MASLFPLDRKRFLQNRGANVLLALWPLEVQKKKKTGGVGTAGMLAIAFKANLHSNGIYLRTRAQLN